MLKNALPYLAGLVLFIAATFMAVVMLRPTYNEVIIGLATVLPSIFFLFCIFYPPTKNTKENIMKLLFFTLFVAASACTTTQGQVKELKTEELQVKGSTISGGKIAINSDHKIVIHMNESASDELAVTELTNTHLEDQVEDLKFHLGQCRQDLADPRLGGSGDIQALPEVSLRRDVDKTENMGLDESGDLRIVTEQSFDQKLAAEKAFTKSAAKLIKVMKPELADCQRRLASARQSHGLAPKPYRAKGYFMADGTWVSTDRGETDLSDAFEIAAQGKAKSN